MATQRVIEDVRRATNANGDYLIISYEDVENDKGEPMSFPVTIKNFSDKLEKKWKGYIGKVHHQLAR